MANPQDVKILIVDDDIDYLEILDNILKKNGFTNIEKATNGAEALELIPKVKPDLVILDVMMPEKDGIEAALEIMQDPDLKNTKFIFLTAYGEDINIVGKYIDENIAKQLGALKFFRKQEPLENLIHFLNDLIENN